MSPRPGAVSYATGLALGAASSGAPLILSTAAVPPKHRVTVALGDRVLEAQVLTTALLERSTEAPRAGEDRGKVGMVGVWWVCSGCCGCGCVMGVVGVDVVDVVDGDDGGDSCFCCFVVAVGSLHW